MISSSSQATKAMRLFRFNQKLKVCPDGRNAIEVEPQQEIEIPTALGASLIRDNYGEWAKPLSKIDQMLEAQAEEERTRPTPFQGFKLKSISGPKIEFSTIFAVDSDLLKSDFTGVFAEFNRWNSRTEALSFVGNTHERAKPQADEPPALKAVTLGEYLNQTLEPHIEEQIKAFADCLALGHSSRGFQYRLNRSESVGSLTVHGRPYRVCFLEGRTSVYQAERLERVFTMGNTPLSRIFADRLQEWMDR